MNYYAKVLEEKKEKQNKKNSYTYDGETYDLSEPKSDVKVLKTIFAKIDKKVMAEKRKIIDEVSKIAVKAVLERK